MGAQVLSKFNDEFKASYIEGLKKTYFGVLLSTTSEVREEIEKLIEDNLTKGKITIDGKEVYVGLIHQNDDTYSVEFSEDDSQLGIKGAYVYELLINKGRAGKKILSVKIKGDSKGKDTIIGGPGKISIFPQHLLYVKEAIAHLKDGGNPITELALATGTGKTFIELLVGYLPARLMGIHYISLAPDTDLVEQKRDDWKKLLSNVGVNDIKLNGINNKGNCAILSNKGLLENWNQFLEVVGLENLPGIIKALGIQDKEFKVRDGKISIDGKSFVIHKNEIQFGDQKYKVKDGKVKINNEEFTLDIEKLVFLSFDEEHRVDKEEMYKYRMGLLSALCPTLFLSATPSGNIYEYVKNNNGLIKTLSLKDKMESGAYGPLELKVHQSVEEPLVTKYISELEGAVTFREEARSKKSFYHTPRTDLEDEDLKKDIENYIFYNIQSVVGEPALVLAESNNLKGEFRKKITHDVFKDGISYGYNTVGKKRNEIINHLIDVYGSDKSHIIKEVVDGTLDYKSEVHDYSAFRVMHGVIENTLSFLTGLSRSELDIARFSNFKDLGSQVKESLDKCSAGETQAGLRRYLTEQGIVNDKTTSDIIQGMLDVVKLLQDKKDTDLFTRLVRNWNQDKQLHTMIPINLPVDAYGLNKLDKEKILKSLGIGAKEVLFTNLGYFTECEMFDSTRSLSGRRFTFDEKKLKDIFQYLKDNYEINGNITKIEEECLEAYKQLEESERKRQEYYDQHMYPLEDRVRAISPKGYTYSLSNGGFCQLRSWRISDTLSPQALNEFEEKISKDKEEFNKYKNGKDYLDLDSLVHYSKENLFERFCQVKEQFKMQELYPLLKLRKFSDKYKYIEGSVQDHDALLRMGLCGNYVNHEKVQGFNAIDLQHVVMLIDQRSDFLNNPPQLIQGPGRLRCLNLARPSTFFCYSSERLKFDIKLLQKGDYIDDYNRTVNQDNAKTPEQFGDEILSMIDKLIENEVSKIIKGKKETDVSSSNEGEKLQFKEVDDLAVEVFDQLISAFEAAYNSKGHMLQKHKTTLFKLLNA